MIAGCWWVLRGGGFCRTLPIVRVEVICLHEHIYMTNICDRHLTQHQDEQVGYCHQCYTIDGHLCPVRVKVPENASENASEAPTVVARSTPRLAGPRRPSSLGGDDERMAHVSDVVQDVSRRGGSR